MAKNPIWPPFFGYKMAKNQNFQNRYTKIVQCQVNFQNRYTKFVQCQVNFTFQTSILVNFLYHIFKVLPALYKLHVDRDFQKIITQARNNIFHAVFCISSISTRSLQITKLVRKCIVDLPKATLLSFLYQ